MATLPKANLTINDQPGAFGSGTNYLVVMSCVSQSADSVPRIFASAQGLLAQYNYCSGIDYCAHHFEEANLPVIFVGLPISTPGVIVRQDNSGVSGTSTVSVAVGASGSMDEVSGIVEVISGGIVGTDQILFSISGDGGVSTQTVRLGTATSYTIPSLGLTLSFGSGTLNVNDVFTFQSSAPMWGSTAIETAVTALKAQQNLARSWLVTGDVPTATFAGYIETQAAGYASESERFTYARTQVDDFLPLAEASKQVVAMVGGPSITFAASGHTITRATGSFVTDGFVVGQMITVGGSTSNNGNVGVASAVSATVLTFAAGVVNEGPVASGITIIGSPTITFAASGETATRSTGSGSFVTEGFVVGQTVAITGTTSNNQTNTVAAVSATVLTLTSGVANEGPLALPAVTIQQVQTFGGDVAAQTTLFASVNAQPRIDISYGRGYKQSLITGWSFRRPASWGASLREYQHDVQIPTYRKEDGPLNGWSLTDAVGNTVEYDENIDGGALAGRFTCFRSYTNGPNGTFVALSLTRDVDGSLLSRTHNMAVVNLGSTICQAATEYAIGTILVLNSDGTGTSASLSLLEKFVNRQLQVGLLQQFKEGPRCSSAVWAASRSDVLNIPGATLNGTLTMNLDGTLENIDTTTNIQTAGS